MKQIGDYKIIEQIGAGGMGEVWLAENVHMHKRYALKLLPEAATREANFVARFFDEGRVMAELDHPNIVRVHHVDRDAGRLAAQYSTTAALIAIDGGGGRTVLDTHVFAAGEEFGEVFFDVPGAAAYAGQDLGMMLVFPTTGWPQIDDVTISVTPVPEPATMSLLALGTVAMLRRRKK
ncbi:MAG: PEP-CTERM sorting domain-containing protein [Phycisphaerales bacterium]|jgi:serine/threonine protein kinase|nr:PEP-CTERM sorting domain-containing protein [Phycisphaerales bacterium]MBT7171041.1 PEP-CTERM sorting domain-containing protein [Phycisphaerales bacterium]